MSNLNPVKFAKTCSLFYCPPAVYLYIALSYHSLSLCTVQLPQCMYDYNINYSLFDF